MKALLATILGVAATAPLGGVENPVFHFDEAGLVRDYPMNLARAHLGAAILESRGPGLDVWEGSSRGEPALDQASPRALLADDPAMALRVGPGTTEFVIALGEQGLVRELKFKSYGAAGRVSVSPSAERRTLAEADWGWNRERRFTGEESIVRLGLGAVDARYFRVRLEIDRAGAIGALGIYGLADAREFDIAPVIGEDAAAVAARGGPAPLDPVDLNVASILAGARVIHASAGDGDGNDLIDGDPETVYVFSPEAETPLVVVELGGAFDLSRASLLGDPVLGTVEVHGFDSLPPGGFSPASVGPATRLGTIPAEGSGRIGGSIAGSGIRFLALRWVLDSKQVASAFGVAEVGAFSTMPFAEAVRILQTADGLGKGRVPASREPSEFRYGPLGTVGTNGLRRTGLRGGAAIAEALQRADEAGANGDRDGADGTSSGNRTGRSANASGAETASGSSGSNRELSGTSRRPQITPASPLPDGYQD